MSDVTFEEIVVRYERLNGGCPECGATLRSPLDLDGPRADCSNPRCEWSINLITGETRSKSALPLERASFYADPDPEC